MVKKKIFGDLGVLFLSLSLSSSLLLSVRLFSNPQEFPVKKPKQDYMSTFLSRNTKPLGLKEDLALMKLLRQPSIKWAVRAGVRHILD